MHYSVQVFHGAGNTILSSIIVDNLLTRFEDDPRICITYLYCDVRRQSHQKATSPKSSLLKRLIQSWSSLPGALKDLYKPA
ncbi:hypothetical protein K449DRAFT_324267 [Hypoxylon sp. EC38]|nr:hypothetical protein K449DRAFT_324267 [Hypoxylon sp. EC38]